jgi:hypothetical protein
MFYVKLARGDWETVLAICETRESADKAVDKLNTQYQTDEYYVEPWDAAKAADWPTADQIREIQGRINRNHVS